MADYSMEIVAVFEEDPISIDRDRAEGIATAIDREVFRRPRFVGKAKNQNAVVVKFEGLVSMDDTTLKDTIAILENEFGQDVDRWRIRAW